MTDSLHQIIKSLVIPVYKNAENIPLLLSRLEMIAEKQNPNFEVIFVIDGSPDNCEEQLNETLMAMTYSAQVITLSRNFGSFEAIRTGILHSRGKYIAVMAADLQEPIELINDFFDLLIKDTTDIVFGQRIAREDSLMRSFFSKTFWKFYQKLVYPDIPKGGVDIFACNHLVKNAILKIEESNSSLISQLFWVGFRRTFIPYKRKKREQGKSAWNFSKRIQYMLNSVVSFSNLPMVSIFYIGLFGFMASFIIALITVIGKLLGTINVPGYTTIIILILFFGTFILTTQGIIGIYLWHTFENTKKRPLTIIKKIKTNDQNNHLTEESN